MIYRLTSFIWRNIANSPQVFIYFSKYLVYGNSLGKRVLCTISLIFCMKKLFPQRLDLYIFFFNFRRGVVGVSLSCARFPIHLLIKSYFLCVLLIFPFFTIFFLMSLFLTHFLPRDLAFAYVYERKSVYHFLKEKKYITLIEKCKVPLNTEY